MLFREGNGASCENHTEHNNCARHGVTMTEHAVGIYSVKEILIHVTYQIIITQAPGLRNLAKLVEQLRSYHRLLLNKL
jgi:hypothetical protein